MKEAPAPDITIPRRIEGLTAQWFCSALRVDVAKTEIVDVMAGTCTKIRVALEYREEAALPSTMVVKGGFADHSHLLLGMHETEMRYYRDVAPHVPFDTPKCYFAGQDADSGRSVVVLEDLDRRDVRWLNALSPLDWRDQVAFVDALAALAAQWWQSNEFDQGGLLDWVIHSYECEAAEYIDRYLQPAIWNDFMGLPRCACLPKSLHDRDRMRAALDQLAKRLDTQATTLAHGDAHLGNMYLNTQGGAGFFDAQPRRAPWVKDFAYQMVAALDIEDRRNWEKPLLARYLRKLHEAGVDGVPGFEEAWYDYRCEIAYGLFIFMINEGHFQREEINTAYTARFGMAAVDHGTFDLLR